MIILAIFESLWVMDLETWSTNWSCLSGKSVSLFSISLMAVLLVFHCDFDDFDILERVFMLVEVGFVEEFLQDGYICGVFGEPMGNWPLVFRYLSFCRYSCCHWGVVASVLGFGFRYLYCGESLDL